ncbi:uncharacterized protein LOC128395313 [Panonychus citri]|uniref:uncharacterized protein LOC128395313 n=1 Tax=Panonychus citri TaxID=50023 RepID=UPI002307ACAE|nr:uncharacterized protein LOC128395313 [Panonychus citri]
MSSIDQVDGSSIGSMQKKSTNYKDQADDFFSNFLEPNNLNQIRSQVKQFIDCDTNHPTVLITSGGTTVPMEHNTVRFVDNFSAGTRGSASAEYFLEKGYKVIFLYRLKSLEPFTRHINVWQLMESLSSSDSGSQVGPSIGDNLSKTVKIYKENKANILMITFTTLAEYLYYLREISFSMQPLGPKAALYLAAAVSDFYIPPTDMATHKIQSKNGPISLVFELVPKMLRPLVKFWVPSAFVVSFKLETDESILLDKARKALLCYGHHLVIANILHTRKSQVLIVTEKESHQITLPNPEMEIESLIVDEVISRHKTFINMKLNVEKLI